MRGNLPVEEKRNVVRNTKELVNVGMRNIAK